MALLRPDISTRRDCPFLAQHDSPSIRRWTDRKGNGSVLVLPLTPCDDVRKEALIQSVGTIPFLIVYFAGGLFGNILGGNFSRSGIPSVGASGALVAVVSPHLPRETSQGVQIGH